MFHACLYTICFVFFYTSWHFYAFSRTNLLTRCHSASFLFFAVFVFQKSYTGNILGIGRNKSWTSYFSRIRVGIQSRDGGGTWPGHTLGQRGPGPGRATRGWAPLVHLLMPPFCLYIPLDRKNLKPRLIFHETYYKPPPSLARDREGSEALPGTLPERGIPAGGLLYHHGRLWSDVWVVYLGLRVHNSS
jgi:hypothetical protein